MLLSLVCCLSLKMSLKDYLQRAGSSLSSHSSLIIITTNADTEWTQSLIPLMWRGGMPTVFLFDAVTFGGNANTKPVSDIFQSMNVPCHVIPREMFDKSQARPGHEGEWEWRISATGKAFAVRAAQEDWRGLQ